MFWTWCPALIRNIQSIHNLKFTSDSFSHEVNSYQNGTATTEEGNWDTGTILLNKQEG